MTANNNNYSIYILTDNNTDNRKCSSYIICHITYILMIIVICIFGYKYRDQIDDPSRLILVFIIFLLLMSILMNRYKIDNKK